jgi:hypothetical protein
MTSRAMVTRSGSDVLGRVKFDLLESFRYAKSIYWVVRRATDVKNNIERSVRRYDPHITDLYSDTTSFQGQILVRLWVEQWVTVTLRQKKASVQATVGHVVQRWESDSVSF